MAVLAADWTQLFSFCVSGIVTVLGAYEVVCRVTRPAAVQLAITREVFFRIVEGAELLYTNVVLISHDVGSLVTDVAATLQRTGTPSKTFTLSLRSVGEKYRSADGSTNFNFHTTSPLLFLSPDKPNPVVYVFEQHAYSEESRTAYRNYAHDVLAARAAIGSNPADNESTQLVVRELDTKMSRTSERVMERVQLEPGHYELTIRVKYQIRRKLLALQSTREAVASITFEVESVSRDTLRYGIQANLKQLTSNLVLGESALIPAPEYNPIKITEAK